MNRAEKRAIAADIIAEHQFAAGRNMARRLLRGGAILPSATPRASDLGGDNADDDDEVVATFSKGHRPRRRADGRLDILRSPED